MTMSIIIIHDVHDLKVYCCQSLGGVVVKVLISGVVEHFSLISYCPQGLPTVC